MERLFPIPLYTFLKIVHRNGGITAKGLKNLPPWLLKTILFEPLRWIELATKTNLINQHTLNKHPVFILGYYRSGTTYLQQLFKQDNRLGYMSLFQMIFPEIMLTFEKKLTPVFESITKYLNIYNPVHRGPLTWNFPGEEDAAMTTSLNPMGAQWGSFFPKKNIEYFEKYVFFDNLPPSEKEKWMKSYLFLVKKIAIANQNKPLVLKSPPHTARIKVLLSVFPDAKFIYIYRNPYEVYASNKRLWETVQRIYTLGSTQKLDFNSIILDNYSGVMSRYLQEKDLIPAGRLIELSFENLVASPVASMQRIYESLGIASFHYCEDKMRLYSDSQKQYKVMKYDLLPDEIKTVSERWKPYIGLLNYQLL